MESIFQRDLGATERVANPNSLWVVQARIWWAYLGWSGIHSQVL